MKYLFFNPKGIADPNHLSKLESLMNGQGVEKYLDNPPEKKKNLFQKIKIRLKNENNMHKE